MEYFVEKYIAYHLSKEHYEEDTVLEKPHRTLEMYEFLNPYKGHIESEFDKNKPEEFPSRLDSIFVCQEEDLDYWGRALYAPKNVKGPFSYYVNKVELIGNLYWADIKEYNQFDSFRQVHLLLKTYLPLIIQRYWDSVCNTDEMLSKPKEGHCYEGLFIGEARVLKSEHIKIKY